MNRMESLPINALQSITLNKPELTCYLNSSNNKTSPNTRIACRALAPVKARSSWDVSSLPTGLIHYPKVRRTLSMFETPKEVLYTSPEKKPPVAATVLAAGTKMNMHPEQLSVLAQKDCPLKSFTVDQDAIRRIDRNTLCEILDGQHRNLYDRHVIIDCRFEYEYEGGHIAGAVNINTKERLQEALIANAPANADERTLLVFHCEYSAHRGPRMAMQLRQLDREANMNRYPLLHYPDIVILDGGYSHFFAGHAARCFPQQYVAMKDNADACEREMDRFRHTMKTKKKKAVGRSQTFTFGSTASSVDAFVVSPVAVTRSRSALFSQAPMTKLSLNVSSESDDEAAKALAEEAENDDGSFDFDTTAPKQPMFARRRLAGIPKLSQCSLF
jgi:rhodanese-related sulfurtransferase